MSLIHKAIRKVEGAQGDSVPPQISADEFAGKPPRSPLPPRTIFLLILAILSLAFAVYKKVFHKTEQVSQVQPPPTETVPAQPAEIVMDVESKKLIEEAEKLFSAGNLDGALELFNKAGTSNPEVLNNIGLIYKKKGDLAKAENFYKNALSLKPDYPECLNNLGVLKAGSGDVLEAAVYLKKAVKLQSEYADAYFNLAVLNEGELNFKEAISHYKLFLQFTDTNDEAFISNVKQRIEKLSE